MYSNQHFDDNKTTKRLCSSICLVHSGHGQNKGYLND